MTGRRFKLITDQLSIAFMYDSKNHGKLKNAKILRWRIELSQFDYEIVYHAGKFNIAPDTMSRAYCASSSVSSNYLYNVHCILCHPGVTHLYHYVRTKNLPYSLEEIRKMTANCNVCEVIKPRFYKPIETCVIKATQPMECLSVDLKGPIAGWTKNRYMLTLIDEYSRFPFAFSCSRMDASTVIACLSKVFSLFGLCAFILIGALLSCHLSYNHFYTAKVLALVEGLSITQETMASVKNLTVPCGMLLNLL